MYPIFDSHAHYFDPRFACEYPGGADALLSSLFEEKTVGYIINVGTNPTTSRASIEQASHYDGMYAAVGIHPEDCHMLSDFDSAMEDIKALLGTPESRKRDKIVAIGEIGLDYHWQFYGDIPMDKAKQAAYFRAQMELAQKLGLPVIIHDREAHGDCFETILDYPNVCGVFHSYSGSAEMARALCKRGWYISFSGSMTFKNAERVREAARSVPRDRLMIETDAPYLAPHPHRGKMNHSGLLIHTVSTLSELWNCSVEEAIFSTSENAKRFFRPS